MQNELEVISKKEQALIKTGATRELAYKTLVEACSATIIKYDRDGDCLCEQPDYATRVKAAESISRLHGDMKDAPVVVATSVVINIGDDAFKMLVDMVRDVRGQLASNDGKQTGEIIDITAGE